MSTHQTTVPAAEGKANAGAVQTCEGAHGKPDREAEVDTSTLGNDDGEGCRKQAPRYPSSSPLGSASTPRWSAVDDDTADLLTLVANTESALPEPEQQWDHFVSVLRRVANANHGLINQNAVRPLLRGEIKPQRIGAFYHRAAKAGLIAWTGQWHESDDLDGKNSGKPTRVYRWLGATS